LLESIQDLELKLKALQIPLLRIPETDLQSLFHKRFDEDPNSILLTSRRYNHRDLLSLRTLTEGLPHPQIRIFDQGTLYQENQLPFPIENLPLTFTPFQKRMDSLNPPIPAPRAAPLPSAVQPDARIPVVLNGKEFEFSGGESAAHQRLQEYLWNSKAGSHYHETRNGLLKVNDSSKLSPYLASGCITARQIHHELLRFEQNHGSNEGIRALRYELQWRDYFKFLSLRLGERLFQPQGMRDQERQSSNPDLKRFELWRSGQTGNEFIDANMRELNATGWMSNRGRQNVASFLAKSMNLPWILGAQYFAETLIDYDVETNWGNWLYLAGVGTDPRDRVFNPDLQAERYDSDGAYRKRWSS
jgi:deoxyribodipyrimidine photo-lyase